jgi:hypothetical protein
MIGIYAVVAYVWAMVLDTLAIRWVQKVPPWGAGWTMPVSVGS